MNNLSYALIIPARYASSRLPGKPLVDLCGTPMVLRTYQQCLKAVSSDKIFIATDDKRISDVCEAYGANVLMTSNTCMTGTDRLAECAQLIDADVFINVQGDEPVIEPEDISMMLQAIEQFPGEILNGVCELQDEAKFRSGSIPKVVMREDGRLLYMSRAPIPTTKHSEYRKAWRQVCVYVFPKKALEEFSARQQKTTLEDIEDIEILRLLELGWDVRMIPVSDKSIAVDVPEDVVEVEAVILERNL